jgi:N utilization substance protein A
MNGAELIRIVDTIRREKNIDAEVVFQGIEAALASAAKKHFHTAEEAVVSISRETGDIKATLNDQALDPAILGRIAAQAAKQVIIQTIRDAERASLMADYGDQVGTIVSGQITRIDRGNGIVNLGRGEGFLPRSEQIPGETLHVGDRIRALIIEVREAGAGVKIVLSRVHPELIIRLFELEVPEVADRVIRIETIAREAGHRTKVAVSSVDSRVDAVGACVGIRGSRIKNIVEEVAGEKIDIVRFNESPQVFIANGLKPAEVKEILLNRDINRATVLVSEDQLSLAIGKRGQNVRLAARLSGWNIDIMTPTEYDEQRATAMEQMADIEAVTPDLINELMAAGYISLADVVEVDPETLSRLAGVDAEQAQEIIAQVAERVAELEVQAAEREAEEAAAAEAAAEEGGDEEAPAQEGADEQAPDEPDADQETPAEEPESEDTQTDAQVSDDVEPEGAELEETEAEPAEDEQEAATEPGAVESVEEPHDAGAGDGREPDATPEA